MSTRTSGVRSAAVAGVLALLLAAGACTSPPASPSSAAVATASAAVTHEQNDRVPPGAAWTQHYFPSAVPSTDGSAVELHSDVLLPAGLAKGERVPVILSVGTYFGHSGETRVEGLDHTGPSDRFTDLTEGTDLFDRGYALVTVDLRGFGGSTGCLDFMGAGEQGDVKAAIDWAAAQPWSTGAVGMYGKSYDAITGLVGNNLDQDALKAVVAQEPMWDLQRSVRSNGVPRSPIVDASRSYNDIATLPQMPDDDPRYLANSAYEKTPAGLGCTVTNSVGYRTADPRSAFWRTRDLAQHAKGTDTPLLFTQGFLENVTEADGMQEYLNNHQGPEHGWLGQWDHVRGNDREADGRLKMGREGWFDETIAFYDQYLKGIQPPVDHPAFAVQDSAGSWRTQDTWPVVDKETTVRLDGGAYVDDGAEGDPATQTDNRFVQRSKPVAQATRITGTPSVSLDATGHGNVMVKLYDVAPDGSAVAFDEQVSVLAPGRTTADLKSTEWTLAPRHVLAVEIGTIRTDPLSNWIDTPTHQKIDVTDARLELALQDPTGDTLVPGEQSTFMKTYLALATTTLPAGPVTFTMPPAHG